MDPGKRESQRSRAGLEALLRWGIAGSAAAIVTVALFGAMIGAVDGEWILETLIRVFPLGTQKVGEGDLPALRPDRDAVSVEIEGTIGTLAGDRFVPLGDAEIVGAQASGDRRPIEVGPGGAFRLEAIFPDANATRASVTQLVIRSPGCRERRVPVTRAWRYPRRITLDCG